MKGFRLAVLVSALILAGCSRGESSNTQVEFIGVATLPATPPEETTRQAETPAGTNPDLKAIEESVNEVMSSLASREQSLEAREESLIAREASLGDETGMKVSGEVTASQGATAISYETLIGVPESYINRNLYFNGRVQQVGVLNSSTMQLLLAVKGNDNTILVCEYPPNLLPFSLASGDTVSVVGRFTGIVAYRTEIGSRTELPTLVLTSLARVARAQTAPQETEPETMPAQTEGNTESAPQGPGPAPQGPGSNSESYNRPNVIYSGQSRTQAPGPGSTTSGD